MFRVGQMQAPKHEQEKERERERDTLSCTIAKRDNNGLVN